MSASVAVAEANLRTVPYACGTLQTQAMAAEPLPGGSGEQQNNSNGLDPSLTRASCQVRQCARQVRTGLNKMLRDALRGGALALQSNYAAVLLLPGEHQSVTVPAVYRHGRNAGVGIRRRLSRHHKLVTATIQPGSVLAVEDATVLDSVLVRRFARLWRARSLLLVPVMSGKQVAGSVVFTSTAAPRLYTERDIALGKLVAGYVGSLVQNSRLRENDIRERSTLESIIESIGEGLLVVDRERTVRYCNHTAQKMLGLAQADVLNVPLRSVCDRLTLRVTEPEDWRGNLETGLMGRAAGVTRMVLHTPERREVEVNFFRTNRGRGWAGAGMLLRDVTCEREIDGMKTEFVSVVSHELRSPMTSIYGFAELLLLRSQQLEPDHRDWLTMIHRECKRLSDIVEDLLNVSRIEERRVTVHPEPLVLKPLVSYILAQFSIVSTNHSLIADIPQDTPQVMADKSRLHQVLRNLIDNAVKYSPKGGPVRVRAQATSDGREVQIDVIDQGLGIPSYEVPSLFTKFHRAHRQEASGIRGTGLGLYIVKSLVELMGGRIWVKAKVKKGSTFCFTLPVATAAQGGTNTGTQGCR